MGRLFQPLDELKAADLPEKTRPNWAMTGPGAILVGLSIGAGEIIIWPRLTAQYGAGMTWAAVVGIFLQLWLNFEVGRWTIATGETIYTAFARVWRGFAPIFILLTILSWLAPGWGRASGSALKALLVGPDWYKGQFLGSDTFWTTITFVLVAIVLFGPKLVYKSVEITVETLVVIVTLGLVLVAFNVGTAATWKELGQGIINIPHRDPAVGVKDFLILLVFAGAGGTANLFYSFYLRDKQIGMGERMPRMLNPLRARSEATASTGYVFADTPENRQRFRGWFGFVIQDQIIYFWFLNTLTILLFIFGALAVLRAKGTVPNAGTLIWDEAQILGVWGWVGTDIFLLVGVATLFSTQLTMVDGVSRSIADMIHTNFTAARRRSVGWWYLAIAAAWIIVGVGITAVMEYRGVTELGFLFHTGYMGGFAMALYTPLLLYVNLRYLPRSARPGIICIFMMFVASLVYVGCAAACIYWELTK